MRRSGRWMSAQCAGLVVLAAVTAVAGIGCSRLKERLARRAPTAAPAAVAARDGAGAAHYRLGRHYQERSRHRQAAEEFRKAVAADPGNVKALNALGVSLDSLGRYAEAAAVYARALELDPSLDYVYNNVGYSWLLNGNRTAAEAAFSKALELNPANTVAQNNLARLRESTPLAPVAPPAKAHPAVAADVLPVPEPSAAPGAVSQSATAVVAHVPTAVPERPAAAVSASAAAAAEQTAGDAARPAAVAPVAAAADRGKAAPRKTVLVNVATTGKGSGSVLLRQVDSAALRRQTLLEIADGSGEADLQAELAAFLLAEGYRVDKAPAGNSRVKTMILYREGALQPAYQVAQSIPGNQEMKKTDGFASPDASVRVLLGRDMAAQRKRFAAAPRAQVAGAAGH